MIKKTAILFVIIILLVILAFWSPWASLQFSFLDLLGLKQDNKYSGLQVYSLQGEVDVYVDDEFVGSVNVDGSPLDIFEISPGMHMITIKRAEDENNFFYKFSKWVNFVEGINTVVAYELGPSEEYSAGYIIYAQDKLQEDSLLHIQTIPEDTAIFINGDDVGSSPLFNYKLDLSNTYNILIKHDGYEDIEFKLLPEDEKERELIKRYDLTVEVNLFAYPIDIKLE